MERTAERLAPDRTTELAAAIDADFTSRLARTRTALDAAPAPDELVSFDEIVREGYGHAATCATLFTSAPSAPPRERIPRILGALHHLAQAQERFYVVKD